MGENFEESDRRTMNVVERERDEARESSESANRDGRRCCTRRVVREVDVDGGYGREKAEVESLQIGADDVRKREKVFTIERSTSDVMERLQRGATSREEWEVERERKLIANNVDVFDIERETRR